MTHIGTSSDNFVSIVCCVCVVVAVYIVIASNMMPSYDLRFHKNNCIHRIILRLLFFVFGCYKFGCVSIHTIESHIITAIIRHNDDARTWGQWAIMINNNNNSRRFRKGDESCENYSKNKRERAQEHRKSYYYYTTYYEPMRTKFPWNRLRNMVFFIFCFVLFSVNSRIRDYGLLLWPLS